MKEGEAFTFGLFDKETNQLIGSVTINQLKPNMKIGNTGYVDANVYGFFASKEPD